jgi:hypothetical protein
MFLFCVTLWNGKRHLCTDHYGWIPGHVEFTRYWQTPGITNEPLSDDDFTVPRRSRRLTARITPDGIVISR